METRLGVMGNQLGNWLGFGFRGEREKEGGLAGDRVRL